MTEAVITAAGSSERMGSWKLMLPYKGKAVIDYVVEAAVSAADHVIIVGGFNADALFNHISSQFPHKRGNFSFVLNEDYQRGMFSSIQSSIPHLAGTEADDFFIIHSDMPLIRSFHIKELFMIWDELQSNTDQYDIMQPVYDAVPGHPVIFKHPVARTILEKRSTDSMTAVFADHQVYRVETGDSAYVRDIDTPESYNRLPS